MNNTTILVAEDDIHIRIGLTDTLESEGYQVIEAGDGNEALEAFDRKSPDLVLLDVMMPGKSGYDVCRAIRTKDAMVPVIMLTAKGEEIDKVVGLKLGADDYITKPFGIHELLARIDAVLRRAKRFKSPTAQDKGKAPFPFAGFTVDPKRFKITGTDKNFDLSKREIELLKLFAAHPGEVLDRDTILTRIWGLDYGGTTRTLDQHIAMLRKKIEKKPATPVIITTVHGVGYRFESDE
ncbi:response regulator transcription factor [uncultured Desulfobacter sp.]|uniref:response regulator transcription factor n=1 Tax=uncultured Desulfobacter sp. TaxID=240139 RepID=UPI0029F53F1F|nr:response regulator transcription factor [uncultured Desulfobacter sp.]